MRWRAGTTLTTARRECDAPAAEHERTCHGLPYCFRIEWIRRGHHRRLSRDRLRVGRRAWLDRTPTGRIGKPSEIATGVVYLASEASTYITGAILSIDAGYTAW
ncbi:MAG: SDR family oxidoreductase [Acetobacteraceae bacterium]|nr:SDR family oxidoreductase [Acetobacteraceae bacterium]